jgi:transposase-like protein
MANARHILYTLAEQADARLTEVLKNRTGRTRWTMVAADYQIPEVREALKAKLNADEAWLTFMRTAREAKR